MAHTIRCGRAKHDRCTCECGGFYHGEETTELDRVDPEPLPPVEVPAAPPPVVPLAGLSGPRAALRTQPLPFA